jgi:uncharacterized protein YdhG (YjbR/CyaY superfamily)
MQSKAADVPGYLKEVPPDRAEALNQLRQLCLETLVGYQESMRYGMPCYTRQGDSEPEIAFASQKNHISLYVLKQEVMQANQELLEGASLGKGCIRYSRPSKIDFDVVKKILMESYRSGAEIC